MNFSNGLPSRTGEDSAPVLLVDDEVAILDGLRRQLRRKFKVDTANGGAEALELLQTEPVSVVVSDMRMPVIDGAAVLAIVKRRAPDTFRVMLSGSDCESVAPDVHELLVKPCSATTLRATLERLLGP